MEERKEPLKNDAMQSKNKSLGELKRAHNENSTPKIQIRGQKGLSTVYTRV